MSQQIKLIVCGGLVLCATGARLAHADESGTLDVAEARRPMLRLSASLSDLKFDLDRYRFTETANTDFMTPDFTKQPPGTGTTIEGDTATAGAEAGGGDADLAKQLSNPVANLISVPLQFNYDEGFGPEDAGRLTLNIQPVIPFSISEHWNLITRTIVPVVYQDSIADGVDSDAGLGDILQSFFLSPKEPVGGWILGAGPVALWPTGTDPQLRSEQIGLGPTIVALRQDHGFTYGLLANHVWGITQSDDHEEVNSTFLQPFVSYTWSSATTLTLNMENTYDWSSSEWTAPMNLMLAQIVKLGNQPVQFQIGGRYYVDSPDGGPEWGLRFAVIFLFPK